MVIIAEQHKPANMALSGVFVSPYNTPPQTEPLLCQGWNPCDEQGQLINQHILIEQITNYQIITAAVIYTCI